MAIFFCAFFCGTYQFGFSGRKSVVHLWLALARVYLNATPTGSDTLLNSQLLLVVSASLLSMWQKRTYVSSPNTKNRQIQFEGHSLFIASQMAMWNKSYGYVNHPVRRCKWARRKPFENHDVCVLECYCQSGKMSFNEKMGNVWTSCFIMSPHPCLAFWSAYGQRICHYNRRHSRPSPGHLHLLLSLKLAPYPIISWSWAFRATSGIVSRYDVSQWISLWRRDSLITMMAIMLL